MLNGKPSDPSHGGSAIEDVTIGPVVMSETLWDAREPRGTGDDDVVQYLAIGGDKRVVQRTI